MRKISILIITIFVLSFGKVCAFTINPAQMVIHQTTMGLALSIEKDEEVIENKVEENEETKEDEEENIFIKIINWIKSLFTKED